MNVAVTDISGSELFLPFIHTVCSVLHSCFWFYFRNRKYREKRGKEMKTLANDSIRLCARISSQWSGYQLYTLPFIWFYPSNTYTCIRFGARNFVWQCVFLRLCSYTYFNSNWTSCLNSPHRVITYNIIPHENEFHLYFSTIYFY